MNIDVNKFNTEGYIHLPNIIPANYLEVAQSITLKLKEETISNNLLGTPKDFGSRIWWRGLEMASVQSSELYNMYTSNFMYEIAKTLLETDDVYLFNDQIVVKLPNEDFKFEVHTDNSYGPNPPLAQQNGFKTITCAWILDDYTEDNGAVSILNKRTREWETPYPKMGDIVVWDGNTYHRSGINKSNKPRRGWVLVYANKDIVSLSLKQNENGFKGKYYNKKFI